MWKDVDELTPLILIFHFVLAVAGGYWAFSKERSPLWGVLVFFNPVIGFLFIAALSNYRVRGKFLVTTDKLFRENRMLKRQVFGLATEVKSGRCEDGLCKGCKYWTADSLNCGLYQFQLGSQWEVLQCKGFEEKEGPSLQGSTGMP